MKKPQTPARDLLKSPRAAMAQGDTEGALAQYRAILDLHPGFVPAVQGQVTCLERVGRLEEAAQYCAVHTQEHGTDARIAAKEAVLLRKLGRTEESRATLDTALKKTKHHPTVQLQLARFSLQDGALEAAAKHFADILERRPEHVPARLGAVAVRERVGDLEGAIALCENAPPRRSTDTRIAARLGQLLRKSGDLARSEETLQAILDHLPEDPAILEELARTRVLLEKIDDAEAHFVTLENIRPGYRPALFGRVSCALRRGDRETARAILRDHAPKTITSTDDAEIALRLLELGLSQVDPDMANQLMERIDQGMNALSTAQVTRTAELAALGQPGNLLGRCIGALSRSKSLPLESAVFLLKRALRTASTKLIETLEPALLETSDAATHAMIRAECASFSKGPHAALAALRASSSSPRPAVQARAISRYLAQAGNKRVQRRYLRFCHRRWPNATWVRQALFQVHHACGDPQAARAFLDQEVKKHPARPLSKLYAIDLLHRADPFAAYDRLRRDYVPGNPILGMRTWFQLAINTGDLATAKRLLPAINTRNSVALGARYDELELLEKARTAADVPMEAFAPTVAANYIYPAIKSLQDAGPDIIASTVKEPIPKQIFQYWDRASPPAQITSLMEGWQSVEGYDYRQFKRREARAYLQETFGAEHARAFVSANHVSEESDFFRLCVLFAEGGIYVDADDCRHSHPDALLAEAPGMMVFREDYGSLANNTIIAPAGHPVLKRAIEMVLPALLLRESDNTWSKTGPGLLTRATAAHIVEATKKGEDPGITVLPYHRLLRHTSPHVRVPYKNTKTYWGNQNSWSTTAEVAALKAFAEGGRGCQMSGLSANAVGRAPLVQKTAIHGKAWTRETIV